jgi:hypothetical protein
VLTPLNQRLGAKLIGLLGQECRFNSPIHEALGLSDLGMNGS